MVQRDGESIIAKGELNDLDSFVLEFVNIVEKHTKYVIVSGYVSILFGRSRGTEDVDCFLSRPSPAVLRALWDDLQKSFDCLNCGSAQEWGELTVDGIAVRFSRRNQPIPNMEVKFSGGTLSDHAIRERIAVRVGKNHFWISPLELQIVYKKKVLGTPKDLEDARHLEIVLKEFLSQEKIKYYEHLVEKHG